VRFHFPSFLIGVGVGATGALIARHLRPVLVEVATAAYEVADAVAARVAMVQEDFEDVLAEARARARRTDDARASA
jgi:hypothetical protein